MKVRWSRPDDGVVRRCRSTGDLGVSTVSADENVVEIQALIVKLVTDDSCNDSPFSSDVGSDKRVYTQDRLC